VIKRPVPIRIRTVIAAFFDQRGFVCPQEVSARLSTFDSTAGYSYRCQGRKTPLKCMPGPTTPTSIGITNLTPDNVRWLTGRVLGHIGRRRLIDVKGGKIIVSGGLKRRYAFTGSIAKTFDGRNVRKFFLVRELMPANRIRWPKEYCQRPTMIYELWGCCMASPVS
jgi:hypothetical protein